MVHSRRASRTHGSRHWRLHLYSGILLLAASLLIGRLFIVQVVRGRSYTDVARDQQQTTHVIEARRGEIYMQDKDGGLYPVAINKAFPLIYAVPKDISDPDGVSVVLADILGTPVEEIREKLRKRNDPYEPLLSKASEETVRRLEEKKLTGIGIQQERGRYYRLGPSASQLLGFVGFSGDKRVGQYGVEQHYQDALEGEPGIVEGARDVFGTLIAFGKRFVARPKNGADIILTLDQNIQFKTEAILRATIEKWNAAAGTAIVSEPKTGKIRAMVSIPNFDPNNYGAVENSQLFSNPAVQSAFEPGSVFKPITMGAALDLKVVTPETTYHDTGRQVIDGYLIQNFDNKARGEQTMMDMLEKSLNMGAIFVEKKVGHENFLRYVELFGFGTKSGIDVSAEATGSIVNILSGRDVNYATASFGQGISATPIQLVAAIGAIANGGMRMKPYVAEKFVVSGGSDTIQEPVAVEQVLSPRAAHQLTAMMTNVVDRGYDRLARIPGFTLAGKTGTAQIPDPENPGYLDESIHTFVGFGPSTDPRFLIFLTIERPRGVRFASTSLAPVFRELAEFIIAYYGIPPDSGENVHP
ncbi:MAG: penicillin-binding protein 2 [Parcubacteria group bacterium]|nr:penicillin-binding protein 2 [Parcubacteria group bacterium]